MAAAAVTLLLVTRGLVFFNDEMFWLALSGDYQPDTVLRPHNSHLVAIPRLIYGTLPRLFGLDYLPFRIVAVVGVLTCAALFFVLARRRVGGPAALAPTVVLLFFGSSWDTIVSPVGIPFLLSIAGGLGAFVAVERGDRRGDALALLALLFAIASHTLGVILAIGVGTYLALDRARWHRLWVAAAPLILYAGWWAWSQRFDEGIANSSNLPGIPSFVAEAFAAVLASVGGLNVSLGGGSSGGDVPVLDWTLAPWLALAALVALVLRLRRGSIGPWLIAYAIAVLAFWITAGLAEGPGREPAAARYLFPGAVLVLLIAVEAARGARPGRRAGVALAAAAAIAVAGNAIHIGEARTFLRAYSTEARAQLAMVELAGPAAIPGFSPHDVASPGSNFLSLPARYHNDMVRRYGSFAFTPGELERQEPATRSDADLVLARALGLVALPIPDARPLQAVSACRRQAPGDGSTGFPLRRRVNMLRLEQPGEGPLLLGRLGDVPTVPVGSLSDSRYSALLLPRGEAGRGWTAAAEGPVEVCASGDPRRLRSGIVSWYRRNASG